MVSNANLQRLYGINVYCSQVPTTFELKYIKQEKKIEREIKTQKFNQLIPENRILIRE